MKTYLLFALLFSVLIFFGNVEAKSKLTVEITKKIDKNCHDSCVLVTPPGFILTDVTPKSPTKCVCNYISVK
uniref:Uncharacterized protein n=1 Tax=Strigamia maritima TaxID=126957 RepID=T1JLR1_STRMM